MSVTVMRGERGRGEPKRHRAVVWLSVNYQTLPGPTQFLVGWLPVLYLASFLPHPTTAYVAALAALLRVDRRRPPRGPGRISSDA